MAILFLADAAGIGCANWVLRAIVADVAPVLARNGASALAAWLTDDTSPVELYAHLDVREFTPENQQAFRDAVVPAFLEARARGPSGWADKTYWDGYLRLFENLAEQAAAIAEGRQPLALANLTGVPEHDGQRSGPGWD